MCERKPLDGGTDPECKAGFERVWDHDVIGDGTISTHAPVISSEKCGDKCDEDSNCNTYEYEPKMRKCRLNKEEYPNAGPNAGHNPTDYFFCAKGML